jgi:CRISPR system Cascade subunit CasD
MSTELLLLRLEGPLQSWGGRSRWDVRDTQPEPTKSGLVGLLGCALGYERGDARLVDELDAGLRVGVRVEAPGRILRDYQTVTDFLPTAAGDFKVLGGTKSAAALRADPAARPATIVSPRFYLEDAAFLVALEAASAAPPGLLARCADALQNPHWPLFLGRKACVPTRPVFEALTGVYDTLEEALYRHPRSWLGSMFRERDAPAPAWSAFVEDPDGDLLRQDALRLNAARVYDFRSVRKLSPEVR